MPADPSPRPTGAEGNPASRQATVSEFDAETGAGAVLRDSGRREEFSGAAFRSGGLRLLRIGQRVRLDYCPTDGRGGDGAEIAKITLITMP